MSSWELVLAGPAERQLSKLPSRVAAAMVEFMVGPLLADPHRVGKPLQRELTGYHSARRGADRTVYRIDSDGRRVRVGRIEHRSHGYPPR